MAVLSADPAQGIGYPGDDGQQRDDEYHDPPSPDRGPLPPPLESDIVPSFSWSDVSGPVFFSSMSAHLPE